ncbi:flagellar hook-associated protein FlgK [Desulfolucanica intricata]|uniref:flagellar hook-associated protein FlgK n=1 Tax=Desulfolucanica intricata TaxID=1285191 RepID=UPI000832A927|nr:flagellar hook-associated protein FlgK [Desulfolucanica intricata]
MSGTFFGLEIARRALQANRMGMDVTGNNVANANVEGYSRQRANFVSSLPYTGSNYQNGQIYQLGTGANVGDIQRIRDEYVDYQLRSNLSEISYWEKNRQLLQRVEAIFPDPANTGIQMHLNEFFNGWQEVNENPQDKGLRVGLLEKSRALTLSINQSYEQLNVVLDNLNKEHEVLVAEVERITGRICQLNEAIYKSYAKNNNVLMDERDLMLDELAKLVKIEVKPNTGDKDLVNVSVNGKQLINGTQNLLTGENFDKDIFNTVDVGGSVGSVVKVREQINGPDGYMQKLQKLASQITEKINGVYENHNSDFKFFKPLENLQSNKIIELNLATGDEIIVGSGAAGDTQFALEISQLRNKKIEELDNNTFESYFQEVMVSIGEAGNAAGQLLYAHESIGDQLYAQRESVSGVSIDEEMVNLMQFQFGYQASAKILTTIDEMLETLLNTVR